MFNLDPVMVLEETDDLKWAVRVAAYNVVVKDRNAAVEAANRSR